MDVSLCEMQPRAEGQIPRGGVRLCQLSLAHCSGKITAAPTLWPCVARKQYWPSADLMPAQGSGVRGDSMEADARCSEAGSPEKRTTSEAEAPDDLGRKYGLVGSGKGGRGAHRQQHQRLSDCSSTHPSHGSCWAQGHMSS